MSFGTSSGGMVPTVGFPFPAVASGSFTVVKTGVYEAHLVGGGSAGVNGSTPGSGGAVILGRKLYKLGDVISYIVGAAGLGVSSFDGGTTVFDQFAANGGFSDNGGQVTDLPAKGSMNIGFSGGSGSYMGAPTPNLAGEVKDPTKTGPSLAGGSSAYGKGGQTVGASATGYGAGGAKGTLTIPGGNGSQGCIYLFGPL